MTNGPRPPAHVAPYVEALGVETAVQFLLMFGGAELYIARDPKGASKVAQEMGLEVAMALAALAERVQLPRRVPLAKPWIAQHLAVTAGLSGADIARRMHVSDVAVRRYLKGYKDPAPYADPRQQRLF